MTLDLQSLTCISFFGRAEALPGTPPRTAGGAARRRYMQATIACIGLFHNKDQSTMAETLTLRGELLGHRGWVRAWQHQAQRRLACGGCTVQQQQCALTPSCFPPNLLLLLQVTSIAAPLDPASETLLSSSR